MKKLVPALAMLLISAVLLSTASFAWFSMNTTVTVTGMSVTAKVNDNLQIAETTVNGTTKEADSAFKYGYIMTHTNQLLEPVSTINGVDFYYTSTQNVQANGDAAIDKFAAYNHANTTDFDINYDTSGAKGYVEYAVQLKADNSHDAVRYINLSTLDITYNGAEANQKAFRVAVFVNDMGADGSTAATAPTESSLKTLLGMSGSAYYTTGKAVTSTSTRGDLTTKTGAANIGSVAANSTRYFKVVVRLWLEGEDTTCKNETFAALNGNWNFDLKFTFDETTGGVTVLNQAVTASKLDLSTAPSTGSVARTVDGINYYEISGHTGYYTTVASTAVSNASIIYSIDNAGVVLDVTNLCTLPTAP